MVVIIMYLLSYNLFLHWEVVTKDILTLVTLIATYPTASQISKNQCQETLDQPETALGPIELLSRYRTVFAVEQT